MSQIAMNQTSRKYDLEERTARFDEPVVKLHHFFIENLLSRFVPPCPALSRFAGSGEAMTGSGEARKIGNWKLKIGIIALLFFIWCDYASAFTITTPTKNKVGLVGHWTFDGADMVPNVRDKSGQGNHGTIYGMSTTGTTTIRGKLGQGLRFDGVDDFVQVPAATSINDMPALSISFWAKPSQISTLDRPYVVKADNASGGHGWSVGHSPVNGTRLIFAVLGFTTSDLSVVSADNAFVAGQMAHYLITWDGTNQATGARLYKNGVELSYSSQVNGGSASPQTDAGRPLRIGYESGFGTSYINGAVDDVRVYNRVLSASEIQALYKMGEGTKTAVTPKTLTSATGCTSGLSCGLVGHWTFDGADMVPNVRDKSGQGNHGTISGMSTTGTTTVRGKLGQALQFDGVDDFVPVLAMTLSDTAFSYSFWMKSQGFSGTKYIVTWGYKRICYFRFTGSNMLICTVTGSTTGAAGVLQTLIDNNNWHHVVYTSTANAQELYIDGVSRSTSAQTLDITGTDFLLGFLIGGGSGNYFNGSLDDVRIYNRALSASEIQALYKMGEGTKTAVTPKTLTSATGCTSGLSCGLVGHWTFDGADMVPNVRDKSGQGNHGTISGMSTTGTTTVRGKLGQGLQFDGVDDYVSSAGTVNGLSLTNLSYSFWFKTNRSVNQYMVRWGSVFCITNTTGKVNCTADGVSSGGAISSGNVDDGKWHHVAYIVNENVQNLYVDNVAQTPASETFVAPNAAMYPASYTSTFFQGSIDDVRIYNRALSAQEIQQLYNMGR